jgi:hypothetical protein
MAARQELNRPRQGNSNEPAAAANFAEVMKKMLESMGIETDPDERQKKLIAAYKEKLEKDKLRILKEKAEKFADEALKKGQHVTTSMSDRSEPYATGADDPRKQAVISKVQLNDALAISQNPPEWAKKLANDLNASPEAMQYLADYLMLPPEVRENPKVHYFLTANLVNSMNADMPDEVRREIWTAVRAANLQLQPRFGLREVNQTLGEGGMGGLVTDDKFKLYDKNRDPIPDGDDPAKTENLKWLLQDMDRQLTALDPEPEHAAKILQKFEEDLARGTYKRVEANAEVVKEIDTVQAQPFIERIKREIGEQGNKSEVKKNKPVEIPDASRNIKLENTFLSGTEKTTDARGAKVDLPEIQDNVLASLVFQLQQTDVNTDLRTQSEYLRQLQRVDTAKLSESDKKWHENVSMKTEKFVKLQLKERFQPDAHTIWELSEGPNATLLRDAYFYERIVKILDNPNEEARRQLNLYDEADWEYFTSIVKQAKNGEKLAQHYESLKETVIRLSDMGYWANNAAGDVESLKKAMDFMDNSFAIEALSDPWTVAMFQCHEQAIKILRDSNDQFVDPNSAAYDPRRYDIFLDELTLQLFDQSLSAGAIRDYMRDPTSGFPIIDEKTGQTFKLSDKAYHLMKDNYADPKEHEQMEELLLNRKKASLRLAKGIGVLTNRTPELFAFTRTPGDDKHFRSHANESYETAIGNFSSKVMGGLTRWDNPMSEWFCMYGFGDTLFVPFFNYLVDSDPQHHLYWTKEQAMRAMDIASTGDIQQLKKEFGKGSQRLMDMLEGFGFTGSWGPLSKWRTGDATMSMSDMDQERLGVSMRLQMAHGKAEDKVKELFKADYKSKHSGLDEKTLKIQIDKAWEAMFKSEAPNPDRAKWEGLVEKYKDTYTTWLWMQATMRNPQGVASALWSDYESVANPNSVNPQDRSPRQFHGKLRSKIMHEIFTADDLRNYKIDGQQQPLLDLVMERDVAKTGTMNESRQMLLRRISIVDGDLAAVQRLAMNKDGKPRDIDPDDFRRAIIGDREIVVRGVHVDTISEARRREQAKQYWDLVQKEMLGKALGEAGHGWDYNEWKAKIEPIWTTGNDGKESLSFGSYKKIEDIIEEAHAAAHHKNHLNHELLERKTMVHDGTEDCQWDFLDVAYLGQRHWSRRGGDKLTRAKTLMLMMKSFHGLTGKPKMEDLVKIIAEIGMQEKDHDPKEAAKFASLWAGAINGIYKQRALGGVPFAGKILPSFHVPMSIAQERMGTHSAVAWSVNNTCQFFDQIGATRVIPEDQFFDGIDFGPYTMKKLEKNMGANRWLAASEMFLIGGAILFVLTSLTAFTKQVEEEGGSGGGHGGGHH